MTGSHAVEGLIKWAAREPWCEDLDAFLDLHLGMACEAADVTLDELDDIIGPSHVSNLWGCAFEDFVSSGADDQNIAVDYLKRRGWKESAGTRAYIMALRQSRMSLYEVSGIVAGESFLARDLIGGGDPVRVLERTATRALKPWDRIAARLVTVRGRTQITGGLLVFDRRLSDEALGAVERLRAETAEEDAQAGNPFGDGRVPAGCAPLFSALWLEDALRRVLDPTPPELHNHDGDPIAFVTLRFPIASGAKREAIRAALDRVETLRAEDDAFWNWFRPADGPGRWSGSEGGTTLASTLDDGSLALGCVELDGDEVTLSVNSEARAERGRALIASALGDLVGTPLVEHRTLDELMAARDQEPDEALPPAFPPDEHRHMVHQSLTDHYQRMIEAPIPMLGNCAPRDLVATPEGRERVVEWLKLLENGLAGHSPDDPMASYDAGWIWEELGVADRRR